MWVKNSYIKDSKDIWYSEAEYKDLLNKYEVLYKEYNRILAQDRSLQSYLRERIMEK